MVDSLCSRSKSVVDIDSFSDQRLLVSLAVRKMKGIRVEIRS